MFKRVICLIIAVFTLLSAFVISSSAATDDSGVMKDLSTLVVDGVAFSEEQCRQKYGNIGLHVITVVEQNFDNVNDSPNFAFYVYVYNPMCLDVKEKSANAMQASYIDDCKEEKYTYYKLELRNVSADKKFLKFKVVNIDGYRALSNLYKNQKDEAKRIYNIASIRLWNGYGYETYPVNKAFYFSGANFNNTLTCTSEELGALQVEIHPTNWISPNAGYKVGLETGDDKTQELIEAGIYDHYEINSLYFRIPRSLFEGSDAYEDIKYIGAKFDAYKLTPIIVTAPSYFSSEKGQVTKNAILDGTTIPMDGDIDVFDISAAKEDWFWGTIIDVDWVYTENGNVIDRLTKNGVKYYNNLAYYFENSQLEGYDFIKAKSGEVIGFTSEQLEEYFLERYNDPHYYGSLYTDHEPIECDYWANDYKDGSLYEMTKYQNVEHDKPWYKTIGKSDDSYLFEDFITTANFIDVIKNPAEYINKTSSEYKNIANSLFIGQNDVENFIKECNKAVQNDEMVVLLRFAMSDYTCAPIVDTWEAANIFNEYIGVSIEKWGFFNVNLMHIAFARNEEEIVVPVVSNTVNSAGDGVIMGGTNESIGETNGNAFGDRDDNDDDGLQKILMIVGIVLLVVLLFVLIRFFFKLKGDNQKINIAFGPPSEEKKPKRKWFRR